MKTQTRLFYLSVLTVFAGALLSPIALAEEGGGSFHVLGELGVSHEDNIFRTSTLEEDDLRLEFAPGLEWKLSESGAASTTIRYLHRFVMYDSNSELDDNFAEFDFKTAYDSGVVLANIYASYKQGYSNTFDLDDNSDIFGVLINRDNTKLGVNVKKDLSELTAMKIGLDYSTVDYEDGNYTGNKSWTVPFTYFYQVRPNVDMTAGVRYRYTDTDTSVEYNDWYAYVGAVGELFSPVVYADVKIGYQRRNAKNSDADASSPAYKLSLIYTGNAKANYYLTLARDYRTSSTNAQAYAYTSGQLGANYSITDRFGVNAAFILAESEYEESVRQEDITMFHVGASYNPNDYLTFSASYAYRDIDGNVAKYTTNEFRVFASLRY
jgi:hypothetical protein